MLCECGKRCYHSKADARDASRRNGARIRVYPCPLCHTYHTTREVKQRLTKKRQPKEIE